VDAAAPDGFKYRVQVLSLQGPRRDEVRIWEAHENDDDWTLLSMRLDVRSRLWAGLFATWPPENLDEVDCTAGLTITFHDHEVWESPVLPFELDKESFWRARYDRRRKTWTLSRLRAVRKEDWPNLPKLLPQFGKVAGGDLNTARRGDLR
jgi:hypothetical protein